jgi:predicted lactoylglutathione lyase
VEQRLSLVTLGVADVGRARRFYEALGWRVGLDVQETVFFQAGGLIVTLWSRSRLAEDTGVADDGAGFDGIVLAHNVRSREEVDAIVAAAEAAGATVTVAPEPTFYGGYAGKFLDPDGHAWEIAHNPGFPLDDDGAIRLP